MPEDGQSYENQQLSWRFPSAHPVAQKLLDSPVSPLAGNHLAENSQPREEIDHV